MTKNEQIEYWLKSSEHDYEVFHNLFKLGNYDWCLFMGHLVIEKILKAHYIFVNSDAPPKIHDLVRLAQKCKLDFLEDDLNFLEKINSFNISARYPDDKFKFYKLCTKEFTEKNYLKIMELYSWLKLNLTY